MAFETREDVFDRVIGLEVPECPHCGQPMSLWEEPMMSMDDGLGWGTPYLFICFNDDCPPFVQGRKTVHDEYGRGGSFRCLKYPEEDHYDFMHVGSLEGGKGQIVDEQARETRQRTAERLANGGVEIIAAREAGDGGRIMEILLSAIEPVCLRIQAAEAAGEICGIEAVDALVNMNSGNPKLAEAAAKALAAIHARNFTRECPYCAEIVKQRAKICKSCGGDLTK